VSTTAQPGRLALGPAGLAAVLIGAALVAWIVTIDRMDGMDAGPGTDLGGLGWYVGVWVTMMAAMMLPSLPPAASARPRPLLFAAGYLLAWTAVGLGAYVLIQVGPSIGETGRVAVLVAAGAYELTPQKAACLRRCREPWPVRGPELLDGLRHAGYCIGCSAGLMAALFALGWMSLGWMALIAGLIAVEKLLPWGTRVAVACVLAALAVAVAV
jgi:predicted metal-binding membrane protein